jgi:ribosome biogenesis GTPase / thiamine phosphate phosphatase
MKSDERSARDAGTRGPAGADTAEPGDAGLAQSPCGLESWGWDEKWAAAFAPYAAEGRTPARVIAQHRGTWLLAGEAGEWPAKLTGRLRHSAGEGDLPAVGDWVACVRAPGQAEGEDRASTAGAAARGRAHGGADHHGGPRMDAVLPRRSAFLRRAAGSRVGAQTVAANVDTLFIVTSLNEDLNPRRLERYVALARESGADPVLLLTKDDLVDDSQAAAARLLTELRIPVVTSSSRTGEGMAAVRPWLIGGRTIALVGSSGVGKSSLLNRLAGAELMPTGDIREGDGRGRHTTTHRELFRLPGGALMLDTPGVREIGLWDVEEGLADTFEDIVELADGCLYRDCRHANERGCAVMAAVRSGGLDEDRLASYRQLGEEMAGQPSEADKLEARRKQARAVSAADHARAKRRDNSWRER